jgi:translation initiation factor IF-1
MTVEGSEGGRASARADHDDRAQRATVLEVLTNGLFRLRLLDGNEVTAHVSQDLRMAISRLLPGDPVLVDLSPFDPKRARIRRLLQTKLPSQHESPPNPPQQRELS